MKRQATKETKSVVILFISTSEKKAKKIANKIAPLHDINNWFAELVGNINEIILMIVPAKKIEILN